MGVVGKNDDYAGQLPVAFIVLKEAAKESIKQNAKAETTLKAEIMKVSVRFAKSWRITEMIHFAARSGCEEQIQVAE